MAFFPITPTAKFGRDLSQISKLAASLKANVDLQVARVTEMTDQQIISEFGIQRTQAQLLSILTSAQTQLAHASIVALATQMG